MEAQPHEGIHSKASPNVPRPEPATATRRKGLGRFRGMGMGAVEETPPPRAPNYRQTGRSWRDLLGAVEFSLQIDAFPEWAMPYRTSDVCGVKADHHILLRPGVSNSFF